MKEFFGHTVILGRTGSGKTYHVINKIMPSIQGGVLFWNGGHETVSSPLYLHVDKFSSVQKIINSLRQRKIIIYTPDFLQKVANEELKYWQELLMKQKNKNLSIIIDEAPRYAPQGSIDTACHLLATGGRNRGITCYFLCQRIADLSKTIATQCRNWIIFEHSSIDRQYLIQRGLSISEEESTVLNTFKYKYLQKKL